MNKISITLLFVLAAFYGVASPIHNATLPIVPADGFYAIDLSYQLIGLSNPDLSDLRFVNASGQEVPYLIERDIHHSETHEFIPYPVEFSTTPRSTDILVETGGKPVSSFVLRIKNADVDKEATLRGSNDRQTWYAVKDQLRLTNNYTTEETEIFCPLRFPLSDYAYYQLSINDSLSAPLNIVSVGKVKNESAYTEQLLSVPPASYQVKTVGKQTEVMLTFAHHYDFLAIRYYISAPRFYNRELQVYLPTPKALPEPTRRRNRRIHPMPERYNVETLRSDDENSLLIDYNYYTDTLRMTIDNGDDQPLTIDSIQPCIARLYAVAWLEKGATYTVTFGDKAAVAPRYDLSFRTQLPDSLAHLSVTDLETDTVVLPTTSTDPWIPFFKTYGIWLIIGAIITQILYMVWKITKKKP